MPLLSPNTYRPPAFLRNGHISTLYANFLRSPERIAYQRERIGTGDGDFLDLDWNKKGNDSLLLLIHGLEGNANAPYMKSMSGVANFNGWDTLALNLRGCSGELNQLFSMYHSGKTDDLDVVLRHVLSNHNYQHINLVGFSLGGNLVMKYIGEQGKQLPGQIQGFAGISVPFDLLAATFHLARPANFLYENHLLSSLKRKLKRKAKQFPGDLSPKDIRKIRDFESFDNLYTAPAHGFKDAYDYWDQSSCIHYLKNIGVPGLVINPLDDPFIPVASYPFSEAKDHQYLHLETPKHGGHVGSVQSYRRCQPLYHEQSVMTFFSQL